MIVRNAEAPIGAEITGIDLSREVADAEFERILGVLHDRGVIVIRDQHLDEAQQVRFARRFGELQKILFSEHLVAGFPELFLISNIVENGKPIGNTDAGRFWHTDGAYLPKPHNYSMLYAIEVPRKEGLAVGDTFFAGMAAAYDALGRETKARIDGKRAVHSIGHRYETKTGAAGDVVKRTREHPPVSHPVAIRHPATGRLCLYVTEGYTSGIEGLSDDEARPLLEELCRHAVRPEFQYRHRWREGDLLIWDNRATQHRATFDYALPQRRLMRRATVAGAALG
jgi:taurine dioxygenase